ncbi:MAG: DUF4177 domain-containing protein [Treponema sp.]|nr:DUF4177 domain-containing protein [Treponema sp.]
MEQWEYKVLCLGNGEDKISYDNLETELNKLGQNGWEIVGTLSPAVAQFCSYSAKIILKRRK